MLKAEPEYIGSFPSEQNCPKLSIPEFAFIGRSNVGKSSLINALTGRKELAKVSKTPGKTQMLNFFLMDKKWHIVDLPGYGYAKISKRKRGEWEKMIERYLVTRKQLICAFVLLDARLPLQEIDLEFINWLGARSLPFSLVYTKSDKVKSSRLKDNIKIIQNGLLAYWNDLPSQFVTSAETKQGIDELFHYIENLVDGFYNQIPE